MPETATAPVSEPIVGDAMEQTIRATLAEQTPETPNVPVAHEAPRGPDGKFLPKAEVAPSANAPVAGAAVPAGEAAIEEAPVVIPEGYVAAPVLPDDKARGFSVRDADGEIMAPDLTWELTANGKPRSLSTDKLVAYAQMGVYNHELHETSSRTQQQNQQLQSRVQQVEAYAIQLQQERERLVSDPDFLVNAINEYERQNTPEARALREREMAEQDRQAVQMERATWHAQRFIDADLEPALDQIATALPTVTRDELAARLFIAADPYRRNGVLMPQGFAAVATYVVNELAPWAKQLHEHRMSETPSANAAKEAADAKKKATEAAVRAAKAKRQVAGTIKPQGNQSATGSPRTPSLRTTKDVESAVIGGALASMRGSG